MNITLFCHLFSTNAVLHDIVKGVNEAYNCSAKRSLKCYRFYLQYIQVSPCRNHPCGKMRAHALINHFHHEPFLRQKFTHTASFVNCWCRMKTITWFYFIIGYPECIICQCLVSNENNLPGMIELIDYL